MVSAINHTAESRRVLTRAEAALARDDVPAAAAHVWDAAASAMDSIAKTRGWKREEEYDLVHAGSELAREVGNGDISMLVRIAHTTPWLVEEGWITKSWVAGNVESVRKLLKILDNLDVESPVGGVATLSGTCSTPL